MHQPIRCLRYDTTCQRTSIDVAFIPCVRGPHILACSFPAVASFWRCPAYQEHPWDQAEPAPYRLRSNEAFRRRADRCLRDLMSCPFSREQTPQSACSYQQADSALETPDDLPGRSCALNLVQTLMAPRPPLTSQLSRSETWTWRNIRSSSRRHADFFLSSSSTSVNSASTTFSLPDGAAAPGECCDCA